MYLVFIVNISSARSPGGGGGGGRESYPDIKLIHKMLTDNLLSIIGVNNHRKEITLFSKTFL